MFWDSHAHLTFADFAGEREAILQRAHAAGVEGIISIGTRKAEVPELVALCRQSPSPLLAVTVGIHPHHAAEEALSVEELVELASRPGVVAIGETGLDFFYNHSDTASQEASFRRHIRAACRMGLPLVIHTRDAESRTRAILEEEDAAAVGGVLHCFSASRDMADWAVEQGFHLSLSGMVTFKAAGALRETVAGLPLERLLLETDSPYLAPVPHRGRRNEPAFVAEVAAAVAAIQGRRLDEVAEVTSANTRRLFRLENGLPGSPSHREVLAYVLRGSLYLNISRGCTLHCAFCPKWQAPVIGDFDLSLRKNPRAEEVIQAMGDIGSYREVVFCGFGEPTLRLGVLLEVAREVKRQGGRVRINTDGLANRVHRRDVTPELAGLIDEVSVSLNAQNAVVYNRHCQPAFPDAWEEVQDFIRKAVRFVPTVTATAIDGLPGVDMEACESLALSLGARFRARFLNDVG
ncbi:MAG: YchF/TatD family DNA exonuclease [Magnetococcales bacterium]|nr:YchF/TatD family DNA exonuclease [Magnetococcales bacterium]